MTGIINKDSKILSEQAIASITEVLNKKEALISNAERTRLQAETKKEGFRIQYAELNNEIKALGIDPKNAKEYQQELASQIMKELKELEELLPEGF